MNEIMSQTLEDIKKLHGIEKRIALANHKSSIKAQRKQDKKEHKSNSRKMYNFKKHREMRKMEEQKIFRLKKEEILAVLNQHFGKQWKLEEMTISYRGVIIHVR